MRGLDETTPGSGAQLAQLLAVLRRRVPSIAVGAVLFTATALTLSVQQTPMYLSTAKVLVQPVSLVPGQSVASLAPNLDTEKELAASAPVAELAAGDVGFEGEPEALVEQLSVEVVTATEILEIGYLDPDPARAQRMAQAFADAYLESRRQQALDDLLAASASVRKRIESLNAEVEAIDQQLASSDSPDATLQARATSLISQIAVLQQKLADLTPPDTLRAGQVVVPAGLPTRPAQPNHVVNGGLGLLVGLMVGMGVAFIRHHLDDRVWSRADLEEAIDAPVLAAVPTVSGRRRRKDDFLITVREPRSPASEAFATLRTSLMFTAARRQARVVLVTSPSPRDGKTWVVANLGVALARAGKRVIVVSADLRKPRLHRRFDLDPKRGLTEVLTGRCSLVDALVRTGVEGLQLLPSGRVPANPVELLGSDRMRAVLDELAGRADIVLVDSAPVLPVADALALAPRVDGVLLVARAEATSRSFMAHTVQQLDQMGSRVLGAVLNGLEVSRWQAYGRYGYRAERREEETTSWEAFEFDRHGSPT
ncbi:MAG: polysaccharide biosynthesis tyrosine autokinase [Actinobacteria bacterium]|nr:polysaccharide biosynthesis tyrosine autokinase [Actinomycetota bacterium]